MKLYKKTLIICICIFVTCFLLSILFKFTFLDEIELFKFVKDYMIGITCSILVVIITTYVQFKFEQRKSVNSLLTNIHHFYFHYLLVVISLDPEEKVSDEMWKHHYDSIQEDVKNITYRLIEIEWFSKKKEMMITELHKDFLQLFIVMSKALNTQKESSVKEIVDNPVLKNIKDNVLLLSSDNSWLTKGIDEDFEKAEAYLEELKKKGHWKK